MVQDPAEQEKAALEAKGEPADADANLRTVHLANATANPISVIIGLSPEWGFIDLLYDAASLMFAYGDLAKAVSGLIKLKAFTTFVQLPETILLCTRIVKGIYTVGEDAKKAASDFLNLFYEKYSVVVELNDYSTIYTSDIWHSLFTPDGVAALMGAETLEMTIYDNSDKKCVNFSTNDDWSWIARKEDVVRSKYGTIWQEDPGVGRYPWWE